MPRPRRRNQAVVEIVRLIAVGAFAAVGFQVGRAAGTGREIAGTVVGIMLGTGAGYVLGGVLGRSMVTAVRSLEQELARISGGDILAGVVGTATGVILAFVACWPLLLVPLPLVAYTAGGFIVVALGYLGYRTGRIKRDDLLALLGLEGRLGPGRGGPGRAGKLVDSSALIDGRLLAIARAGFLDGRLTVPTFVLAELQGIADAGEAGRRVRGRRGLDVLAALGKELGLAVEATEVDYPDTHEVDAKLLRLAREHDLALVTCDHNLARVAELSGVAVLNPNVLAEAVRPPLLPGDQVSLGVQKEGRETGQGIGYLDDGTMVVVEGGRNHVGHAVEVTVTSVLQTAQGRLVFAKLGRSRDTRGA